LTVEDESLGGRLPPIVRDANRLLLVVEQCVRHLFKDFNQPNSKDFFMNLSFLVSRSQFQAHMLRAAALACAGLSVSAMAQQVCNPSIPLTRPDSRYEAVAGAVPSGSEVRDKVSGLIWQRCLLGTSWNGSACTGSFTRLNWTQALDAARTASATAAMPATAWRLPNRNELLSLAETACYNPAINATWFPNVPTTFPGYVAWSASPYAGDPDGAWLVFSDGADGFGSKGDGLSARLVRSGQ
jgi:hypothetical protein